MNVNKTILLTNVFNEEYLLLFWLNHHKNMFDELIVIDYNIIQSHENAYNILGWKALKELEEGILGVL